MNATVNVNTKKYFSEFYTRYTAVMYFFTQQTRSMVDLVARFLIAQQFFVSGVLKLLQWDTALKLAQTEYPLSWLSPATTAYLGVTIEIMASALLALGLFTRAAAAAMLGLTVVIHLNYVMLDENILLVAILGWYVVHGSDHFSLDRVIHRGLLFSGIPLANTVMNFTDTFMPSFGQFYLLSLRLWFGCLALSVLSQLTGDFSHFLLLDKTINTLPIWINVAIVLLAVGLLFNPANAFLLISLLTLQLIDHEPTGNLQWLTLCLVIIFTQDTRQFTLDQLLARLRHYFFPMTDTPCVTLPKIVIVGAGFGGLSCTQALKTQNAEITLIDRNNYHLFQPLLYQVATTALSPNDIAIPIRGLFREHKNVRVIFGEVVGIDTAQQEVIMEHHRVKYDYLVLATGASHSYFGRDDWSDVAPGLKRIEDANEMRRRILSAFELAETEHDPVKRQTKLTFIIVGGGPTGVELAGSIAELARHGMDKDFRNFDPASSQILLVQAGPRLLPAFPESLSIQALDSLTQLGVKVLLNSRVEAIDDDGVTISGQRILAHTVLWAAGVTASPAAKWLSCMADNAGRVVVNSDLSVPNFPNVFVIGDTAASNGWNGMPVPGLAPAAKQAGTYVARVLQYKLQGRHYIEPFRYQHLGSLATIGRKSAIADFGKLRLHGSIAWWFWGAVHIMFLTGMRNRVSVVFDWIWAYLTYRGGSRLITNNHVANNDPHS